MSRLIQPKTYPTTQPIIIFKPYGWCPILQHVITGFTLAIYIKSLWVLILLNTFIFSELLFLIVCSGLSN
jgi:hypothetical protein